MNTQEWQVLNPVAAANIENHGGARRFADYSGKRIGLWWNGKSNGDIFLDEIGVQLQSRFPGVSTIRIWERDASTTTAYGVTRAQLEEMAKSADLVIGGLSD